MNSDDECAKPSQILWTGGWDSTFQLLQLLLVKKTRVTPIYLIDEDRASTGAELLTMRRIKAELSTQHPAARNLLNATRYHAVSDIAVNSDITDAYWRMQQRSHIGVQYDWLARFCAEHDMTDLQLCIHHDDVAHGLLKDHVTRGDLEGPPSFYVRQNDAGRDEYAVFKWFAFPVFDLTKIEMRDIARRQGLNGIMEITWFCHNPGSDMKPCGLCNPCRFTIEEGLARRVPLIKRLQAPFTRSVIRPSKRLARKLVRKGI